MALWQISTPNEENCEENKHLFNFMHHITAKISKYKIRTFFSWKSGYRTKKVFLQLWLGVKPKISRVSHNYCADQEWVEFLVWRNSTSRLDWPHEPPRPYGRPLSADSCFRELIRYIVLIPSFVQNSTHIGRIIDTEAPTRWYLDIYQIGNLYEIRSVYKLKLISYQMKSGLEGWKIFWYHMIFQSEKLSTDHLQL